jgi:ATP-dependent exoDNAse (exonuclease V) alpha subunit
MKLTIAELLAQRGIKRAEEKQKQNPVINVQPRLETFSTEIILNPEQQMAVDLAKAGKSFCLVGEAGTGKTTSERLVMHALLSVLEKDSTHTFKIQGTGTRHQGPAITVVAYTRIAAGNSRRAICGKDPYLEDKVYHNITTVHNLLEFEPEFFWDSEKEKESMRFTPRRHGNNPLTVKTIIIEESSQIDLSLWEKLYDAMLHGTQMIFVGDINQLPPVFGPSILNFALVQLPVVKLNQIYRQAEGSLVLENAHRILRGENLQYGKNFHLIEDGTVQHGQIVQAERAAKMLEMWYKKGQYDPATSIVLTPFGKQAMGSANMNNYIAEFLSDGDVYEVIAGRRKLYLAVGDKIMYNKQVGYIEDIQPNRIYAGTSPKMHSKNLSRFGHMKGGLDLEDEEESGLAHVSIDLENLSKEDIEEVTHQASHVIQIKIEDTGEEIYLRRTGELSEASFSLAYCLTVHKAQGCEWKNVFILLHKDHSIMAYNELLYTAVTRSSEKVIIMAKEFMVRKAIATRRIKGNSLAEKIEYFNANMSLTGVSCTKD